MRRADIFAVKIFVLTLTFVMLGCPDLFSQNAPTEGQVVFYDKSGCTGTPYLNLSSTSNEGNYPDFGYWHTGAAATSPNWHDKTSCIELGPRTKVTIYEHANYGGAQQAFENRSFSTTRQITFGGCWWDNKISSAKIVASPDLAYPNPPVAGQVLFYDNSSCDGEPYLNLNSTLNSGDYPDFGQYHTGAGTNTPNWHDKASCIELGPKTKATLYEHSNYGGQNKAVTNGNASKTFVTPLCGWWDNKTSSTKVRAN